MRWRGFAPLLLLLSDLGLAGEVRPLEGDATGPTPQIAAKRLGSEYTPAQREEARRNLEMLGADALPTLAKMLLDKDVNRRERLIQIIGETHDPRASVYLLKAYEQNPSPAVRTKILESLGKMRDISLASWFAEQFKSKDTSIRCYALWALGELHLQAWAPFLEKVAREDTGLVRVSAVDALGKCGTTNQVPLLLEYLRYEDSELRYISAKSVGYLGSPRIVPVLSDLLLKETDIEVQEALAGALGRVGGEEGARHLVEILTKTESPIIEHLAELGLEASGKAAVPLLLTLLHGHEQKFRIAAAKVLASLRAPEAVPDLIQILKERDQALQLSAIAALGECGTWDTVSALSGMANSSDRIVREAASQSIQKLARRHEELYQQMTPRGVAKGAP